MRGFTFVVDSRAKLFDRGRQRIATIAAGVLSGAWLMTVLNTTMTVVMLGATMLLVISFSSECRHCDMH